MIAFTGEYLQDFDRALAAHPHDPEALAATMNERYGALTLPVILDLGAAANTTPAEDAEIVDAEIVDAEIVEED
ncbi:hypothetical protein ACFQ1I_23545 [Kitasatospora arboriphila]